MSLKGSGLYPILKEEKHIKTKILQLGVQIENERKWKEKVGIEEV